MSKERWRQHHIRSEGREERQRHHDKDRNEDEDKKQEEEQEEEVELESEETRTGQKRDMENIKVDELRGDDEGYEDTTMHKMKRKVEKQENWPQWRFQKWDKVNGKARQREQHRNDVSKIR